MKFKFLTKPIASFPTMWTICTTEEEFHALQKKYVSIGYQDEWTLKGNYDGVTHFYDRFIIVCLPLTAKPSILVHESVHVFEAMLRDAGENAPGEEVRAYCIQFIFEQMMVELQARNAKGIKHEAQ